VTPSGEEWPAAVLSGIERRFRAATPAVDFWQLRVVLERSEGLAVVRGVAEPPRLGENAGVMITVASGGGVGYGATSDLTAGGLRDAAGRALDWARASQGRSLVDAGASPREPVEGRYRTTVRRPWDSLSTAGKLELLASQARELRRDARIVDWSASLWHAETHTLVVGSDGDRVSQVFHRVVPLMSATAWRRGSSETRTFGGHARCRQGGLEVLDDTGFRGAASRIGEEALELLAAPSCPSAVMDCVIAADQMILQVHESIGHPLELDRILGDERNFAGRSFVTPDMFGSFRYGAERLNVTFDPTRPEGLASFAFDDEGTPARREHLIRDGVLVRALGGRSSQARAGIPGVACARASGWNRPAIDRMANLDLEPGDATLAELVAAVDDGVYLETNASWSIDDSRRKFQFGCERGRRILGGKLGGVVRRPSYRGLTTAFWHSLDRLGGPETVEVLGTPFCGKGEPNQIIHVGHSAPPALFRRVDVFGAAQ
jgi:predicted Zn-dependent protease